MLWSLRFVSLVLPSHSGHCLGGSSLTSSWYLYTSDSITLTSCVSLCSVLWPHIACQWSTLPTKSNISSPGPSHIDFSCLISPTKYSSFQNYSLFLFWAAACTAIVSSSNKLLSPSFPWLSFTHPSDLNVDITSSRKSGGVRPGWAPIAQHNPHIRAPIPLIERPVCFICILQ